MSFPNRFQRLLNPIPKERLADDNETPALAMQSAKLPSDSQLAPSALIQSKSPKFQKLMGILKGHKI